MRLPRYTVRLRLTLMYGCVFLVCGAGLLGVTYLLVRGSGSNTLYVKSARGVGVIATGKIGPGNVEQEGVRGFEAGEGPGPQLAPILPVAMTPTPRALLT